MKLAVAFSDLFGSGMLRMIWPYRAFAERTGHQVEFVDALDDPAVDAADVVVLQRPTRRIVPSYVSELLARGKRIVVDCDDDFHSVPASNPSSAVYFPGSGAVNRIERTLKLATLSITSTEPLAEAYRRYNPRTMVCENALPDHALDRHLKRPITGLPRVLGQIRIGWAGGCTHSADTERVRLALEVVMRDRPGVRVVLGGADYRDQFSRDLVHRVRFAGDTFVKRELGKADVDAPDLPTERYWDLLAAMEMDIAIAPIAPTAFNYSKSALKLMEYGMVGVPVVASDFGPYREYRARSSAYGQVGAFPRDDREWVAALTFLVDEWEWRRKFAIANAQYVTWQHRMSRRVGQWVEALASIGV